MNRKPGMFETYTDALVFLIALACCLTAAVHAWTQDFIEGVLWLAVAVVLFWWLDSKIPETRQPPWV